jgi:hypothetical protein
VLGERQGAGLGDPARLDGVGHRARRGAPAGHDLGERGEFGAVGVGEAVHEEVVRRPRGEGGARLDGAQRQLVLQPGGDAVLHAVQFQADVVAPGIVPGVGDDRDRAVVEGEDGRGGVDVARLGDVLGAAVAAGGVHLDDLAAGDPADGVEVVDRAVAEDAAGDGDVRRRRRGRVQRGRAHGVQFPELAADHGGARGHASGVEAAG